MNLDINKEVLEDKIRLIERHVNRLEAMKGLSVNQLANDLEFSAAAWNLRSALESVFEICAHVLSRIPGLQAKEYKEMALAMGEQGILSKEFATQSLKLMACYRNRLTHFYFEVNAPELHDLIQNHLGDFGIFLNQIKKLL